jgi:tetratricopeptide (TPR) repeat protein
MTKQIIISAAALTLLLCSCARTAEREVRELKGLDGRVFQVPEMTAESKAKLDAAVEEASRNLEQDSSENNFIWLGRREAYRYGYYTSIDIFTRGLEKYPESYRLFRHRGHRYITVREFERAVADLQKAAALMPEAPLETEPDGQPNKLNIPLSSTQFNIWYHLGLAHYLRGDFESALRAYIQCMEVSVNDDLKCATADWLYMTLRRMGLEAEATRVLDSISPKMTIIENDSYHKRLLLYKGLLPVDSVLQVNPGADDYDLALATQGYGVGNWYLYQGDTARAVEIFRQVTQGKHFSSFGFIAAEAELRRIEK